MTALVEYERLEAVGHWRSHDQDPGREVVVKFGKSTLVIEERANAPLVHWSLPALRVRTEAENGVTYAPDYESTESLTIEDPEMRAALARVVAALPYATAPPPSRLPALMAGGVGLAILILGVLNLPGVLGSVAPTLIPPERAQLLAEKMLVLLEERTGPACSSEDGDAALDRLARRLEPQTGARIGVSDLGDLPYLALPAGRVLVSRHIAEHASSPEELAGWAALAIADGDGNAALGHVFSASGLGDGVRFLANGEFSEHTLDGAVNSLLISSDVRRPLPVDKAALTLSDAGISSAPMIAGIKREAMATGPLTIPLAEGSDGGPPILADSDWMAVKSICEG